MRIKSNFKDYYDGVQRTIFDPSVVYIREQLGYNQGRVYYARYLDRELESIRTGHVTVGVAGKFYHIVSIGGPIKGYEYYYDIDSLDKGYEKHFGKKISQNNAFKSWQNMPTQRADYVEYFKSGGNIFNPVQSEKLFHQYKTPLILLGDYGLTAEQYYTNETFGLIVNPNLSRLQFFKVMDAVTVFQEIYMYLSGVLAGNNPEIPKVSDEDLITAKGFDLRTSFRKAKENK